MLNLMLMQRFENRQRSVVIPDELDVFLSKTKDLTDGEANLWRYLYRKASHSNSLVCSASKSELAEGTRKQERSIYGLVDRLESKGYIIVHSLLNGIYRVELTLPNTFLSSRNSDQKEGNTNVIAFSLRDDRSKNEITDPLSGFQARMRDILDEKPSLINNKYRLYTLALSRLNPEIQAEVCELLIHNDGLSSKGEPYAL